jgi:hypothetical protein
MNNCEDKNLLEVDEFLGEGYQVLVRYGDWRVAVLRFLDDLEPQRIASMERHLETIEVFVLLKGRGVLILGGNDAGLLAGVYPQTLESGKIYSVKQSVWHSILLSRDASVLIIENLDTATENSEYCDIPAELRNQILTLARQELPEFFGA